METTEDNATSAADLAFDRCNSYQWCGHEINWPGQANWLWVGIIRSGNYVGEQIALIMMWVGTREDIKETEKQWHRDPDSIIDELSEFLAQFDYDSPEAEEALRVGTMIRDDSQASRDELEDDGEGSEGAPKKYRDQPDTSSTCSDARDLPRTKSDINSPMRKGSNSFLSNSIQPATSS